MKRAISKAIDRADAQVQELRRQLDHQDRLVTMGLNAALVVHELRNLLTPLRAYAQLALQNPGDTGLAQRALEHAAAYSERACAISDSLLQFARPAADTRPSAEIGSAIERALTCLVRSLESDGIRFQTSGCKGLTAAITPSALQHVLMNLISNSRAAMLGRGGDLVIEAARSTGNIIITVRDSGRGMTDEQAAAALRPFVTSGEHPDRSGLGMAVCHRLVSDAGGSIAIASAPGKGTCVTITLPAANAPTTAIAA